MSDDTSTDGSSKMGTRRKVGGARKMASRDRILNAAAVQLRERGPAQTNIADVMSAAGLTIGGFYGHFESKDALLEHALQHAFDSFISDMVGAINSAGPDNAVDRFARRYFLQNAFDTARIDCPMAAIGSDIGRGSDALKCVFGTNINRVVDILAANPAGQPDDRTAKARRELSGLVGAVILARASDPATARNFVAACLPPPASQDAPLIKGPT